MPEKDSTSAQVGVRLLDELTKAMRDQVSGVRDADPDAIHDMRVASRRLRALMKELAPAFKPKPLKTLESRVRSITRALGKPRELDVCLEILDARRDGLKGNAKRGVKPLADRLRGLRESVSRETSGAVDILESDEFNQLVGVVRSGIRPTKESFADMAARKLDKRHHRLLARYKGWKSAPKEENLHLIRIRFKQLRYTCEAFGDAYGTEMKDFLKRLKEAQQALGDWNDHRVLRDYAREALVEKPDSVTLGALADALDGEVEALMAGFERLARDFFSPATVKATRAMLARPSGPSKR